ncbi:MAG: hypothetical protein V4482_00505 [Pseudomonadota bacterium]
MLLSIYMLTLLNATELNEVENVKITTDAAEKKPFVFNPEATEFQPTDATCADIDVSDDELTQNQFTWEPEWTYLNWTYPTCHYSNDMKPTKTIKRLARELARTITTMDPRAIAKAYITLGDAHANHEYKIQTHYYNVALNIACHLNDTELLERAYVALGDTIYGDLQCIESIVWYFEAFQLRHAKHIVTTAQKKIKKIKCVLSDARLRGDLDAYQTQAIKAFFPQLAACYLR